MTVGEYVDAVVVPEAGGRRGPGRHARLRRRRARTRSQVAKVSAVDSYRGLRVLESGLEAGQRVIVEGVQLVRPGRRSTSAPRPLEQFIRPRSRRPLPGDPRFNSRVSRVPGHETPEPGRPSPEGHDQSRAQSRRARIAAPEGEPDSQSQAASTRHQPPAGKKPR